MAIEAALEHDTGPGAGLSPRITAPRAAWQRVPRADRWALALLVALPVLLYVPFTLQGHPVLPGDNLTQNYPLRLLAGELLRSGHVPSWDPLIWSGTPLLAGWNGGSMFPATWLFAVLPGVVAWTVGFVANPIVAAVGAFVLLRRLGCASAGATVGALAFAYTGFMNGQIVHLGLVQGTAFMPWTVLALEELSRRARDDAGPRRLAAPAALLAAAAGLTVLAGDPRAVSTTAIVDVVYLAALLLRPGGRRRRLLGATFAGVGLGALVSAAQWLPGLRFVHSSQRGTTAYHFFGAGSLDLGHIASFVLVPYLFGGNGNFGLPTYAGSYNLPELTIGTGVLATVAFAAYLPAAARSALAGAPRLRRARHASSTATGDAEPARRLGVWYVLAAVGLLLTLGTNTPLAHVLVHLPLFGGERLQNRNAALFDLSLVVLLAFFVDDLLRGTASSLRGGVARAFGLVPLAGIATFVALAYADPAWLRQFGGVSAQNTTLFTSMAPMLVWELVVALGAGAILLRPTAVRRRRGRLALTVLVVLDLSLFLANSTFASAPSALVSGPTATSRVVSRLAGPTGRVALYNPLVQRPPGGPRPVQEAGAPDVNIASGLLSVQGYGSLVGGAYDNATKTHGYENLRVGALSGQTFDVLDLRTLLTLPGYFQRSLSRREALPAPGSPVKGAAGTSAAGTPAAVVGGPYPIAAHGRRRFVLAAPRRVRAVHLLVAGRPGPRGLVVTLAGARGRAVVGGDAGAVPRGRSAAATFPKVPRADVVEVANRTGRRVLVEGVVVSTTRGRVALDGALQGALAPPHWRFAARVGPLVAWRNARAAGLAWLQPTGARVARPSQRAPGTVTTRLPHKTRTETTVVSTRAPALLVRSEAYSRGWTARLEPLGGGPARVVPVRRLGLVQAVPVPTGRYEVTWRYAPSSVLAGLLASALGLAGLAGALGLAWSASRRRRSGPAKRSRLETDP